MLDTQCLLQHLLCFQLTPTQAFIELKVWCIGCTVLISPIVSPSSFFVLAKCFGESIAGTRHFANQPWFRISKNHQCHLHLFINEKKEWRTILHCAKHVLQLQCCATCEHRILAAASLRMVACCHKLAMHCWQRKKKKEFSHFKSAFPLGCALFWHWWKTKELKGSKKERCEQNDKWHHSIKDKAVQQKAAFSCESVFLSKLMPVHQIALVTLMHQQHSLMRGLLWLSSSLLKELKSLWFCFVAGWVHRNFFVWLCVLLEANSQTGKMEEHGCRKNERWH